MIYLYLVLTTLVWAAVFFLGQYALQFLAPLPIVAWRFIVAALALVAYVTWQRGWDVAVVKRHTWQVGSMGVVGIFGFNACLFFGLEHTTPINAALIIGLMPAITTLLNAIIRRVAIAWISMLGFVISLGGVAVIVSHGAVQELIHLQLNRGDAWVLLACVCWSIYSVIPRWIQGMSNLLLTTVTIVVGALALTGVSLGRGDVLWRPVPPGVLMAILIMGLLATVLAYLWWNQAIALIGAPRVAHFSNLVPVFTALIGLALGQPISHAQLFGALLVISGVMLALRAANTELSAHQ